MINELKKAIEETVTINKQLGKILCNMNNISKKEWEKADKAKEKDVNLIVLEVGDIVLLNTVGRKFVKKFFKKHILDISKEIYSEETVVVWVSADGEALTFEGMHPFSVLREWVDFIRRP